MADYIYPSNATLMEVDPVLQAELTLDDVLFSTVEVPGVGPVGPFMPTEDLDSSVLMWEQEDDFFGLQQVRGINGQPPRVLPTGAKSYLMQPGVYGEWMPIDEKQITERRQYGTFAQPIDLTDLTAQKQKQLLGRRLDRIRYIGWTLFSTGIFSVAHPTGAILHTDTFPITMYAGSDWSTVATATPLGDFRQVQLGGPAQGTNFGAGAVALANRPTANYLLSNTNPADLGGKRTSGLSNVLSMKDVNAVFLGEDLPLLVIMDKGYKNDSGIWTRFLANDKVVVIGARPANAPVAKYYYTRNFVNNSKPGPYMKVVDTRELGQVPGEIQVHDGHNGGPAIFYPGSITVMNV
jgi:hypothetical protein